MNFSSRLNRPLLYQEVVSALYQIIDEQKIQPGAQLPSERELIERLGVSRNVLREAFHVMEQRGIIISQQGRGRFLRSLPRNNVQQDKYLQMSKNLERYSLREAYEVRQVLEEKAMELIIRNALLPSRRKNPDLGAASFQNRLPINLLNSRNAPKYFLLSERCGTMLPADCNSRRNINQPRPAPIRYTRLYTRASPRRR